MADEDTDDTELELDLEAEQPSDQPAEQPEAEADEPESDQPEDQPETDQPPLAAQDQVVPETPQKPSRRDSRIQSLTERIRERDTELADIRRRMDELTRTVQQPRAQAETPEQRAQRRALMTPQEQMQEDLREAQSSFTQQIQGMQAQQAEFADRTAFQAQAAANPLYAKYAPKVEAKLAELRAQGGGAPREAILRWLIGDAALARGVSKEGKREVAQAQQRVRRATVRPPNSGSDEAATRRREDSLERRLENLNI